MTSIRPLAIPTSSNVQYSVEFPALHSPWTPTPLSKRQGPQSTSPTLYHSLAPSKYSAYLGLTRYAQLVKERYTNHPNKHFKASGEDDSQIDDMELTLPAVFNPKDKSSNVQIGPSGLDLTYIGPGKNERDAALARANFPMRPQCGIYYFEMKVISKGNDGYIGIGFCTENNALDKLPGWESNSWGYHGDDGHSFEGSGTGKCYGPRFTTNDTIGCGVNFATRTAFFTKNGTYLGQAFKDIDTSLSFYPSVGLRTRGEHVIANFGDDPFIFDIAHYIKNEKNRIRTEIADRDVDNHTMDNIVFSYLIHQGYLQTAKSFDVEASYITESGLGQMIQQDKEDVEKRYNIRSAIMVGNIDLAIDLVHQHYPGLLESPGVGTTILFHLKCRKFVELMRQTCLNKPTTNDGEATSTIEHTPCEFIPPASSPLPYQSPTRSRERRPSWAAIAASPPEPTMHNFSISPSSMDVDDDIPSWFSSKRRSSTGSMHSLNGGHSHGSWLHSDPVWEEDEQDPSNTSVASASVRKAMKYGQQLQEEYRNDTSAKTRSQLVEIFSLLAYPEPGKSPMAHLMSTSGRDTIATDLNSAILAFQHQRERSSLEQIYRQTVTNVQTLSWQGNGKAVLVDTDEHCRANRSTLKVSAGESENV